MLIRTERALTLAARGTLLALLVLVCLVFRHYGVTWDEELQRRYGEAVFDYYQSGLSDDHYDEIFNLYLYGGLFDGLATAVDQELPFRIFDTRHLLNALFGLLGLWGVWRAGRWFGGPKTGLLALILCATTPMYFGHMFNNPKDIPFAAGLIWSLYYMARSFGKPNFANLAKLGIILGLTLGVRVGGVMLAAFWTASWGLPPLLRLVKDLVRNRGQGAWRDSFAPLLKIGFTIVLPVLLVAYAVMLFCWPWAQQSPILNPLRALGEFSNFPQDVEVLLGGTIYRSTQLPWYYVPLYFGVQLPLLFLSLLGVTAVALPWLWGRLTYYKKQALACFLLMALFPVVYAMIRHPALYDAVRHFLFFVPLMSVVIAVTVGALVERMTDKDVALPYRRVLLGVTAAAALYGLGDQVSAMIRLHPYEYIYVNQLAGGVRGAFGNYELDYWGSSFKEAAEKLEAYVNAEGGVPEGKIYRVAICGPWDSAMIYMPPDFDPVTANEPAEFFIATTRWMCQNMRPGKEIIRIDRMGAPLSVVKDLRGGYEYYEGNKAERAQQEEKQRQERQERARDIEREHRKHQERQKLPQR